MKRPSKEATMVGAATDISAACCTVHLPAASQNKVCQSHLEAKDARTAAEVATIQSSIWYCSCLLSCMRCGLCVWTHQRKSPSIFAVSQHHSLAITFQASCDSSIRPAFRDLTLHEGSVIVVKLSGHPDTP